MTSEPILTVNDISFSYAHCQILERLSFTIAPGEIVAIIGMSGVGKTTLFKLITGLLSPNHGSITINNKQMPQAQGRAAYMTQEDLLLPWRTVLRNITLTSELGKKPLPSQEMRLEALQLMESLGLTGIAEDFPHQLSGGMRQRVSLARALHLKKPLLLLDEPFGSLDVILREQLYSVLHNIRKKTNTAILLITHDFRDAISLADRVLLLSGGKISREWKNIQSIRIDATMSNGIYDEMRQSLSLFS